MFFSVSKLLSFLFSPTFYLWVMVLLFLIKLIKKQPTQKIILITIIYTIFICSPVVYLPLSYLEGYYPPINKFEESQTAIYLGGGAVYFNNNTNQFVLGSNFARTLESIRMSKLRNLKTFIISGGHAGKLPEGMMDEAASVKKLALEYGLTEKQIYIEDKSLNTYQEALFIKDYLRQEHLSKIYLVTSALHMPRSVAIFKKQGIEVIPYPVDYLLSPFKNPWDFDQQNIVYWEQVIHEYIGFVAYKLMGYI